MMDLTRLGVKVFADGANLDDIARLAALPYIAGFTTNPTLMKKAGVTSCHEFARQALPLIGGKPISIEVLSDDLAMMEREAHTIAEWSGNIYVKVPITNTQRESTLPVVRRLARDGVRVNVTAMTTTLQVRAVVEVLSDIQTSTYVSMFAGRIADAGADVVSIMREAAMLTDMAPSVELIWASPRELYNVVQAAQAHAHIITLTPDLLAKLPLLGKDLDDYSLETVQMFYRDAQSAGLTL